MPRGKIRFGAIYGTAAIIGYTPQQVNEMSLWQFMSAVEGYRKHHSGEEEENKLTEADIDDVWEWMLNKD